MASFIARELSSIKVAEAIERNIPLMNVFAAFGSERARTIWREQHMPNAKHTRTGLTFTVREEQRMDIAEITPMDSVREGDWISPNYSGVGSGIGRNVGSAALNTGNLDTRAKRQARGVLAEEDYFQSGAVHTWQFRMNRRVGFGIAEHDFSARFFANPDMAVKDVMLRLSTKVDLDHHDSWRYGGSDAVDWSEGVTVERFADGTTPPSGWLQYLTLPRVYALRARLDGMHVAERDDLHMFGTSNSLIDLNSMGANLRLPEEFTQRVTLDGPGYMGNLDGVPVTKTEHVRSFRVGTRVGAKQAAAAYTPSGGTALTAAEVTAAKPKLGTGTHTFADPQFLVDDTVDYLQKGEIRVATSAMGESKKANFVAVGEHFTIPGVKAINFWTREALPFDKVWAVVDGSAATTVTIDDTARRGYNLTDGAGTSVSVHPRPVPTGPYQNCAVTGAARVTGQANQFKAGLAANFIGEGDSTYEQILFLDRSACISIFDEYVGASVEGSTPGGVDIARANIPDSGFTMSVVRDYDINQTASKMRFDTIWGARTVGGGEKIVVAYTRKLS